MSVGKEELIEEIKMYLNHITRAHDYYIAYKTIVDAVNSEAFNRKINTAPAFFSVTLNALNDSLQLELSKLYCDTHKDERTLLKLINKVQANANLFPTEIERRANSDNNEDDQFSKKIQKVDVNAVLKRAKEDLEKLNPVIDNLNLRRDKKIAHNDKKYFLLPRKIYVESPMTMADFHSLIHFAGKFCNELLCYLNDSIVGYNSLHTEDLRCMLMKIYLNEQDNTVKTI